MTDSEIYLHVMQQGERLALVDQHGRELARVRSIELVQDSQPGPVVVTVQFLALEMASSGESEC